MLLLMSPALDQILFYDGQGIAGQHAHEEFKILIILNVFIKQAHRGKHVTPQQSVGSGGDEPGKKILLDPGKVAAMIADNYPPVIIGPSLLRGFIRVL